MAAAANDPGARGASRAARCWLAPPSSATNSRRASRAPHLVGRRCACRSRSPARSPRSHGYSDRLLRGPDVPLGVPARPRRAGAWYLAFSLRASRHTEEEIAGFDAARRRWSPTASCWWSSPHGRSCSRTPWTWAPPGRSSDGTRSRRESRGRLGQLRGIWLANALTQSLYGSCHVKFVLMLRYARVIPRHVPCPALVSRVLSRSPRPCLRYALRQSARTSSPRSRK